MPSVIEIIIPKTRRLRVFDLVFISAPDDGEMLNDYTHRDE
jgi:hypothetical protein